MVMTDLMKDKSTTLRLCMLLLALFWPLSYLGPLPMIRLSLYDMLILAAILIFIVNRIVKKAWKTLGTPYDFPAAAFLAVCICSALHSSQPPAAYQTIKAWSFSCALFFLFFHCSRGEDRGDGLRRMLFASLALTAAFGIGHYISLLIQHHDDLPRAFSFFPSPNLLGAILVILIPLLLFHDAPGPPERILKTAMLIVASLCLVLTFSRSSFIAVISMTFLYCLVMKKGLSAWLSLAAIYMFLFTLVLILPFDALQDRVLNLLTYRWDLFALMRIAIWRSSISMWLTSPLLGVGPHNFQFLYATFAIPGAGSYYLYQPHAHNLFIHLLVETGIAGLLSFSWLLFLILRDTYEGISKADSINLGLFIGFIGYLVHNLFDYSLWFAPSLYLFFMLAGMACSHRKITQSMPEYTVGAGPSACP
jgi:putative inorganic carbon (hco3(-)) transporter